MIVRRMAARIVLLALCMTAAPAGPLMAQTGGDGDARARWRERVAAGKVFSAQAAQYDESAKASVASGKIEAACEAEFGYYDQYLRLLSVTRDLEAINNEAHLVDDKDMQRAIQGKLDSLKVSADWYNAHCTASGRAALEAPGPDPQVEYASLVKRIGAYIRSGDAKTRFAMKEAGVAMTNEQFESANGPQSMGVFGSSGHRFAACAEADDARKAFHNAELLIDYALKYGRDHGIDTTELQRSQSFVRDAIEITRRAC
jgi:hypothetical protein